MHSGFIFRLSSRRLSAIPQCGTIPCAEFIESRAAGRSCLRTWGRGPARHSHSATAKRNFRGGNPPNPQGAERQSACVCLLLERQRERRTQLGARCAQAAQRRSKAACDCEEKSKGSARSLSCPLALWHRLQSVRRSRPSIPPLITQLLRPLRRRLGQLSQHLLIAPVRLLQHMERMIRRLNHVQRRS